MSELQRTADRFLSERLAMLASEWEAVREGVISRPEDLESRTPKLLRDAAVIVRLWERDVRDAAARICAADDLTSGLASDSTSDSSSDSPSSPASRCSRALGDDFGQVAEDDQTPTFDGEPFVP
jgi:hypothetical protein